MDKTPHLLTNSGYFHVKPPITPILVTLYDTKNYCNLLPLGYLNISFVTLMKWETTTVQASLIYGDLFSPLTLPKDYMEFFFLERKLVFLQIAPKNTGMLRK